MILILTLTYIKMDKKVSKMLLNLKKTTAVKIYVYEFFFQLYCKRVLYFWYKIIIY